MAPRTLNPNELIEVVWADTQQMVTLPRHLTSGASKAAQERHLIATGQLIDSSVPILDTPAPEQVIQTVVDSAALAGVERRLHALEQRPAATELPTHDSLERLAISVQRAAISKTEIVAVADEATARIDAVASDIEVRQNGFAALIDGGMRQMADAISGFMEKGALYLADLGQNFALFLDEQGQVVIRVATDVATKVATAVALAEVAKHWGSSITFCTEDPSKTDHASFAKRWYGRDFLIEGDGCGQTTESGLIIWRFAGGAWRKSSELVEKTALVNQSLSVLDKSTQVTASMVTTGGGGGGGGGEHLLANRIGVGGSIAVADSSNWAGISDVTAGQLVVELTALDGGLVGRTYFVLIPFSWDPSGNEFTVDGELGGLKGIYDINVTVQRSAAVAPGVYSGTLPVGANRTMVFLSVVPSPGGGGDTTSFRLAGDVEWAHVAQGNAAQTGRQPLWVWA